MEALEQVGRARRWWALALLVAAVGVIAWVWASQRGNESRPESLPRSIDELIADIDDRMTMRIGDRVQLESDDPNAEEEAVLQAVIAGSTAHGAERDALIAELATRGPEAARRVAAIVEARAGDRSARAYWLRVLLKFHDAAIEETLSRIVLLPLTDSEWLNLAHDLKGHREDWALDLAVLLSRPQKPSSEPDDDFWYRPGARTGTRIQALDALSDWDRPQARTAIVAALRDPDPNLSMYAVKAIVGSGFTGSMEEVALLVDATRSPKKWVADTADIALRDLVDPAVAPPRTRIPTPVTQLALDLASLTDRDSWLPWFTRTRDRLAWDSHTRRIVRAARR